MLKAPVAVAVLIECFTSPAARGDEPQGRWLPTAIVQKVARSRRKNVANCYTAELASHPGLRGEVTVGWDIEASGRVSKVAVTNSTLANKKVEGCIVAEIRHWRFPRSSNRTPGVSYPFSFEPTPPPQEPLEFEAPS